MLEHRAINEKDAHVADITDSPKEALDIINVQCSAQKSNFEPLNTFLVAQQEDQPLLLIRKIAILR